MTLMVRIGSTSTIKFEAVREACERLDIGVMVAVTASDSGVSEQPVGKKETTFGAWNRAEDAWSAEGPKDLSIGIENGVIETEDGWVDLAVIVVIRDSILSWTHQSVSVHIPQRFIDAWEADGREGTVGAKIALETGCHHGDPHFFLTDGKKKRQEILTDALVEVLRKAGVGV